MGASAETALRLHEAATLPLDRLRGMTRGTLHVAILDGADVLYVERREGPGAIPVFRAVGARNAAHVTSSGKVLLAFLPTEQQQRLVREMRLTAKTPRTITSRTAFLAELASVRRQGYAENRGESQPGCARSPPRSATPSARSSRPSRSPSTSRTIEAGLHHLTGHIVETAVHISAGLGRAR